MRVRVCGHHRIRHTCKEPIAHCAKIGCKKHMGGTWQIPLQSPFADTHYSEGKVSAINEGEVFTTPARVIVPKQGYTPPALGRPLGPIDGPTLMEKWQITKIYLPVATNALGEAAAGGKQVEEFLTVNLYRNGDLIWSKSVERKMLPLNEASIYYISNETFSDDFINPIEFSRGQTLSLDASLIVMGISTPYIPQVLIGGFTSKNSLGNLENTFKDGSLSYTSVEHSGHRSL